MNDWLIWSLVLFAAGMIVAVIEVVVPSAGILALAALACLVGSLMCAYQMSGWAAALLAGIEAVCVPIAIVIAFKVLPKTSIGRQMFLAPPIGAAGASGAPASASGGTDPGFGSLLGKEGLAVTMLRPSGTAELDRRRVSVVTSGEAIAEGSRVRVVEVEGNRIVVEAI